jgi:hypothetical protein
LQEHKYFGNVQFFFEFFFNKNLYDLKEAYFKDKCCLQFLKNDIKSATNESKMHWFSKTKIQNGQQHQITQAGWKKKSLMAQFCQRNCKYSHNVSAQAIKFHCIHISNCNYCVIVMVAMGRKS